MTTDAVNSDPSTILDLTQVIANPQGDAKSNIGPDGKPLIIVGSAISLSAPSRLTVSLNFWHPNVKLGEKGPQVIAVQMLLHIYLGKKAKCAFDGVYGPVTAGDVHTFKTENPRVGYGSGGNLWELEDWILCEKTCETNTVIRQHLEAAEKAYIAAQAAANAAKSIATKRSNILAGAALGYRYRTNIHYAEVRPYPSSLTLAEHMVISTDCSGYATLCYKYAKLPDPNGRAYDGYGFTGTLMNHGREIPLADLQVGDLVFYGNPTVVHVAVCAGKGMVYSNGLYPMQFLPTDLGMPGWMNSCRTYL